MRLLDVHNYTLHTFYGDKIPLYAILSHTWLKNEEEVAFSQLRTDVHWRSLLGARKIEHLCQQAIRDGYEWAWIDTCCIDKTNNAELSEAINSMYRWYQKSAVCYVYLTDVVNESSPTDLHSSSMWKSRWWSRAWTLQELLAPQEVRFYDQNWQELGTKAANAENIAKQTSIDVGSLRDSRKIATRSVAQRMSWAARREATRTEDLSYSLLGIFQINMAMLYGEGSEAFIRLQREIMHTTDDLSLFAWGLVPSTLEAIFAREIPKDGAWLPKDLLDSDEFVSRFGIFASQPADFAHCQGVESFGQHIGDAHVEEQQGTLTLHAAMISSDSHQLSKSIVSLLPSRYWIAVLPCGLSDRPHMMLALMLHRWHQDDLNPHAQPRSMRSTIGRIVSTFLVGSEEIARAEHTAMKIDTLSRVPQFQDASKKNALHRTLVLKSRFYRIHQFKSIGSVHWLHNSSSPGILSAIEDSARRHRVSKHTELMLQFPAKKAAYSVFVFLKLKARSNETDQIVVKHAREPAQGVHMLEAWTEMRQTLSDDWRESRTSLQLLGAGPFVAEIETRIVYNQAVSILSFEGYGAIANERFDTQDGNADRLAKPNNLPPLSASSKQSRLSSLFKNRGFSQERDTGKK